MVPRAAARPHGEDFVRAKVRQLDWLTGGLPGVTWSIIACDDGCPDRPSSADLMTGIAAAGGYPRTGHRSVTVLRLAEVIGGAPSRRPPPLTPRYPHHWHGHASGTQALSRQLRGIRVTADPCQLPARARSTHRGRPWPRSRARSTAARAAAAVPAPAAARATGPRRRTRPRQVKPIDPGRLLVERAHTSRTLPSNLTRTSRGPKPTPGCCRSARGPCTPAMRRIPSRRKIWASVSTAIPRERANGSWTGRSAAAQQRPQGVLDPALREPTIPVAGKRARQQPKAVAQRTPLRTRPHALPLTLKQRGVRSVLEQSLRYGPLEARRMAFSVALAIFWRIRGEVQQLGTVAPGHDKYDGGLRDRPAEVERSCKLG
jgi:hypothetical protein